MMLRSGIKRGGNSVIFMKLISAVLLAKRFRNTVKDLPVLNDASLLVQDKNLGGIDFNPGNLDIQTNGGKIGFDSSDILTPCLDDENPYCNETELKNFNLNINGLTPVIIQIAPIQNLPMLLGASGKMVFDSTPDDKYFQN